MPVGSFQIGLLAYSGKFSAYCSITNEGLAAAGYDSILDGCEYLHVVEPPCTGRYAR